MPLTRIHSPTQRFQDSEGLQTIGAHRQCSVGCILFSAVSVLHQLDSGLPTLFIHILRWTPGVAFLGFTPCAIPLAAAPTSLCPAACSLQPAACSLQARPPASSIKKPRRPHLQFLRCVRSCCLLRNCAPTQSPLHSASELTRPCVSRTQAEPLTQAPAVINAANSSLLTSMSFCAF